MGEEIDIPLKEGEKEEKIEFLKKHKFDEFKIHPYYNKNSYIKHGVELVEIKETYSQFEKIIGAFKRPAKHGYKYSFIYQLAETKSLILCFYLDESPPKFFNAYYDYTKQDKKFKKKVEKWLKREFFKKKQ